MSAGLRKREGPPDAPPLLTAGPTQLNYSSNPPSWMLPVLFVSTTGDLCAVRTLLCEWVHEWVSERVNECEKVRESRLREGTKTQQLRGGCKCFRLTCPWGPIMGLLGLCGGGCVWGEGWDPGGPWWRKFKKISVNCYDNVFGDIEKNMFNKIPFHWLQGQCDLTFPLFVIIISLSRNSFPVTSRNRVVV